MSVTTDKDFLLFRLRLILFHAGDPKFVSLPSNDEFSYIASSLQEHHSQQSNPTLTYKRQESLNPFGPHSPSDILPRKASMPSLSNVSSSSLVSRPTIRPKRFAGSYTAQDLKVIDTINLPVVGDEQKQQILEKELENPLSSQQELVQELKPQVKEIIGTPFVKSVAFSTDSNVTFSRLKGRSASEPLKQMNEDSEMNDSRDLLESRDSTDSRDSNLTKKSNEGSNSPIFESVFASNEYMHPPYLFIQLINTF